jgi:hypothetical protein
MEPIAKNQGGHGVLILTALLVMLRVSGIAPDLPWLWVFSPLWLPFALVGMAMAGVLIAGVAAAVFGRR